VLTAGGFLSQAYGWQEPFVFLLVFSAGIIIPSNIFLVRETHQYKIIWRLDPSIAQTVREGPGILANPPKRGSPWAPLVSVCNKRVIRHLLQASAGSACLMSSQTSLTGVLAAAPYNMSPGMIGVAFITMGCAGMIASPLGGRMFDRAGARSPQPMPRLMWNTLASLIGKPHVFFPCDLQQCWGNGVFCNRRQQSLLDNAGCVAAQLATGSAPGCHHIRCQRHQFLLLVVACAGLPTGLLIYGWSARYKAHLAQVGDFLKTSGH
jgi:hypothetical protein